MVIAVERLSWSDRPYLRWLTLFASGGTLVCCALPIVLVSMGFGALAASLSFNIPGLVFLAENKFWTLSLSALLLLFLAGVIWRPGQSCPADPGLAAYCARAKTWNRKIFSLSVIVWAIGFFFSYLLLPLRQLLDS
jgi:thiamine transporter ThiT